MNGQPKRSSFEVTPTQALVWPICIHVVEIKKHDLARSGTCVIAVKARQLLTGS